MSSVKDNWRTPPSLFNNLNNYFNFYLDLAADSTNHLCNRFFTLKNSALSNNWKTAQDAHANDDQYAWCNPPYGSALKPFMEKAAEENRRGFRSVFLIACRPDTDVWHKYIFNKAGEIWFVNKRITFLDENNKPAAQGATFPSAIVIYHGREEKTNFKACNKNGLLYT